MNAAQHAAHYAGALGFALVDIPAGRKAPVATGWQHHAVTDPAQAARIWQRGQNMGLLHSLSRTCTIDVDHAEYLTLAAAALGFDLLGAIEAAPVKIQGKNGAKPLFRLPEGVELPFGKLEWVHETELTEKGKPKRVSVVEFRTGAGKQDVLPPSIHPDTGRPYRWVGKVPRRYSDIPELPTDLLAFWQQLPQHLATMKAACPWAEQPTQQHQPANKARPAVAQGESVIDAYNQRYTVADVLAQNGYTQKGGRWLSPNSSTKLAGVTLYQDAQGRTRATSHHASDDWSDGKGYDAFGLYTVLEHGGNMPSAVKAAAELLGMVKAAPAPAAAQVDALAIWREHGSAVLERQIEALGNAEGHTRSKAKYIDILTAVHAAIYDGELYHRKGAWVCEFGGLVVLAERMLYRGRLQDLRAGLDYLHSIGMLGKVVSTNPADRYAPLAVEVSADPRDLPFMRFRGRLTVKSSSYTTARRNPKTEQAATKKANKRGPQQACPLHDARHVLYWLERGYDSVPAIAQRAGIRERTVRRHLAALEAAGLLVDCKLTVSAAEVRAAIRAEVESDPAYRAARARYLEQAAARRLTRLNAALTSKAEAKHKASLELAAARATRLSDGESCAAVFGVAA